MSILITAAATAYAYQIERLLSQTGELVFGDSGELPAVLLKSRKFMMIPDAKSPSFTHEFLKACLDQNVEMVLPLRRAELKALSEARTLFEEYGIRLIVPALPALEKYEMKSRPGTIYIKEQDGPEPGFTALEKAGIYLLNNEGGDQSVAIFTVD